MALFLPMQLRQTDRPTYRPTESTKQAFGGSASETHRLTSPMLSRSAVFFYETTVVPARYGGVRYGTASLSQSAAFVHWFLSSQLPPPSPQSTATITLFTSNMSVHADTRRKNTTARRVTSESDRTRPQRGWHASVDRPRTDDGRTDGRTDGHVALTELTTLHSGTLHCLRTSRLTVRYVGSATDYYKYHVNHTNTNR